MNYPVDTNIFLEILLGQAGRKKCEAFLQGEKGAAWIPDFTLHSIGVLLFRQKRPEVTLDIRRERKEHKEVSGSSSLRALRSMRSGDQSGGEFPLDGASQGVCFDVEADFRSRRFGRRRGWGEKN